MDMEMKVSMTPFATTKLRLVDNARLPTFVDPSLSLFLFLCSQQRQMMPMKRSCLYCKSSTKRKRVS